MLSVIIICTRRLLSLETICSVIFYVFLYYFSSVHHSRESSLQPYTHHAPYDDHYVNKIDNG